MDLNRLTARVITVACLGARGGTWTSKASPRRPGYGLRYALTRRRRRGYLMETALPPVFSQVDADAIGQIVSLRKLLKDGREIFHMLASRGDCDESM